MAEQGTDWRRYSRIGAASTFVSGPASMLPLFAPLIVGAMLALTASPYSLSGISLIISAEIAATALASSLSSGFVHGRSIRRVAVVTLGVCALASALSAFAVASPFLFLTCRIFAGLSAGVALTASGTAVASSGDPDRTQSVGILIATMISAVLIAFLGSVFEEQGARDGMLLFALFSGLVVPGALLLRADDKPLADDLPPDPLHAFRGVKPTLHLVLFGSMALAIADSAVYVLATEIGSQAGLGSDDVALILSVSIILALVAGILAAWMGTRYGRRRPLAIALGLKLAATVTFTLWITPAVYFGTMLIMTFFYVLALPYIVGLATSVQPDGRGTVLNSVTVLIGAAIGPAIGGALGEAFGFAATGCIAGGVGLIGLLAILRAACSSPV